MATASSHPLKAQPREPDGSRQARRLRRAGTVPGVVYGGGAEPAAFQISARELRHALAGAGAVLELKLGDGGGPVVVKDLVRHPVTGDTVHLDLLRVRLDEKIHTTVALELTGAEGAAGVRLGGVLEHTVRELNIEALPTDIPHSVTHDVSEMEIGDTLALEAVTAPAGVTLLDDPETVLATLSAPRLQVEPTEGIEQETAVVGDEQAQAEGDGEAASDGDGAQDSDAEA
ncbi:MAG: 50S ribosomal protein L25 [Solirubrobacteraceae bacterium]